jgi:hypothetical protein
MNTGHAWLTTPLVVDSQDSSDDLFYVYGEIDHTGKFREIALFFDYVEAVNFFAN